jgi:hypothetical protein
MLPSFYTASVETGPTNSVLTHSQQNLLSRHCGLIGKASAQEPATVGAFDLRFSDTGGDERMTALRMLPPGRSQ